MTTRLEQVRGHDDLRIIRGRERFSPAHDAVTANLH